nr:gag pol polyprotein [Hymenolepis microstoma]
MCTRLNLTKLKLVISNSKFNRVSSTKLASSLLNRRLQLHEKSLFSKLDLIRAYHHISMSSEDIAKTTVITPFVDFVFTHIDDLLIASSNSDEHKQHLRHVFGRLQKYGITVDPEKWKFGHREIEFLGHHINGRGITPLPEKTQSIMGYPIPQSAKSLHRFLGVVNYYGRFIPNCAQVLKPLTDLLKGNPKHFKMTAEAESAFSLVKRHLSNATTLNHLNTSKGTHMVSKLQWQLEQSCNRLSKVKFNPYPSSRRSSLPQKHGIASDIRHIDGTNNFVADAMSRLEEQINSKLAAKSTFR